MSDSFMHKHQASLDSQREEAEINWLFPEDDEEVEDENGGLIKLDVIDVVASLLLLLFRLLFLRLTARRTVSDSFLPPSLPFFVDNEEVFSSPLLLLLILSIFQKRY